MESAALRLGEVDLLNIGILGAARIAPAAIIEPARRSKDARILAVASKSGKAKDYAATHGIPKTYDSYEALFADPEIDLVYNALAGNQHGPQSIAAVKAGKHVLCEKPFSMNVAEARDMVAAAKAADRRLVEAFHYRHHPVFLHALEAKRQGRFGAIKSLRANFSVEISNRPGELRHIWAMGGGALMDLGCYPLHEVRAIMGEKPEVVSASATKTKSGVDESVTASLKFPSGVSAEISTNMAKGEIYNADLVIEGEKGRMFLRNPVLPHRGHSVVEEFAGEPKREFTLAAGTTYDYQLAAIVEAIARGTPLPTENDDAIENMEIIDAIYAKAGFPAR